MRPVSEQHQQLEDTHGAIALEIAEIIEDVTGTIFANYFNHIAQTENDFPKVDVGHSVTA